MWGALLYEKPGAHRDGAFIEKVTEWCMTGKSEIAPPTFPDPPPPPRSTFVFITAPLPAFHIFFPQVTSAYITPDQEAKLQWIHLTACGLL